MMRMLSPSSAVIAFLVVYTKWTGRIKVINFSQSKPRATYLFDIDKGSFF